MCLILRMTFSFVICCVIMDMANGACCYPPHGKFCADCTLSTPRCGYHRCNLFGCGCTCRREPRGETCYAYRARCYCDTDRRKRRDVSLDEDMSASIKFASLDINKDGLIEQFEFIKALEQMDVTDNTTMFHHWSIMDEDRDGTITLEEFDKEKP
uniref:Mytimycin 1 n=1 Tax=Mytilus coruscus TaxID=42192 RepID=A0A8F6T7Z2_MYTCO|nr:mytimycin 1 [Mytilus coruscus]